MLGAAARLGYTSCTEDSALCRQKRDGFQVVACDAGHPELWNRKMANHVSQDAGQQRASDGSLGHMSETPTETPQPVNPKALNPKPESP